MKKKHYQHPLLALFLFVTLAIIASIAINDITGEDLSVEIVPAHQSHFANFLDNVSLNFTTEVHHRVFCSVFCNYSFIDLGDSKIVDYGSFRIDGEMNRNYTIPVTLRGEGQLIYSFKVACHKQESRFCTSSSDVFYASSLSTINYGFSSSDRTRQQELKILVEQYLEQANSSLREAILVDSRLDLLNQRFTDEKLLMLNAGLNSYIQSIKLSAQSLHSQWNEQDLDLLESKYNDRASIDSLENFTSSVQFLEARYLQAYSSLLNNSGPLDEEFTIASESSDTNLFMMIDQYLVQLNQTIKDFNARNSSLDQLERQNSEMGVRKEIIYSISRADISNMSFISSTLENRSRSILCLAYGFCSGPVSSSGQFRDSICNPLANLSGDYDRAKELFALEQNFSSFSRAYDSYNFSVNVSEWISNITLGMPISSNPQYAFAANLSVPRDVQSFLKAHCPPGQKFTPTFEIIFEPLIPPPIEYNFKSSLETPHSKCCLFGKCEPCCSECEDTGYPVVFVHGHSFNSQNRPKFTADAFNLFQAELEKDGYLNAGVLYHESSPIAKGTWGLTGRPAEVSVTYYYNVVKSNGGYIVFDTKSENIQTYAIRLRELIDLVKERTGKKKVILVAHSMGGLVSRSYLQIFGNDSVQMLIMIGTPNHGLNSTEGALCGFFGEEKECSDMRYGSFFLSRLNQDAVNVATYNIIGTGCETYGEDGDGVVKASSSNLPEANNYYVKGNCQGTEVFHTEMINPKKNKQVFELVRDILSQV